MSLYEFKQQQRQDALKALALAKAQEKQKLIQKLKQMPVKIEQIDDTTIQVDDINIIKDQNNNWVAKAELTVNQTKAFQLHLQAIEQYNVKGKAEYTL